MAALAYSTPKSKRPIKFATGGAVQPTPYTNLVASQFPNAAAPTGVLAPQVGNRTFDPYTNALSAPTDTGSFDPYAHLTSSGTNGVFDVGYDQAPAGSPYAAPSATSGAHVTPGPDPSTVANGPSYSGALGLFQGNPNEAPPSGTEQAPISRNPTAPGSVGAGGGVNPALYSPGYGGTPPYPGTGAPAGPTIGGTSSPYPYQTTGQADAALTPSTMYSATPGQLPNPLYPSTSNPFFPGTSDQNLAPNLQQQKNAEYTTGSQLLDQYQQQSAASGDTASQLQKQYLQSIAPELAGQGGYTPEQQAAIEAQTGPFGLNTLDPNANIAAFQQGAGNINQALGAGGGAVNTALDQGAANVNAQINPEALRVSPQFQQDLLTQAANSARVAAQAQEQQNTNAAFAAGNVSPEALAAMNDRANQTGELASADALTQARIQGEQARVAAEQQAENIQTQNAQENAQRAVGTQLQQEATNVGAQGQLLGAGQQATAAQQTQGMDLNQLESGRAQTVSNANLQAGQEGRAGLAAQGQQAQQTSLTAGQQELGAYGTQSGAVNQSGQEQITNKATNAANSPINVLLGGGAKGTTAGVYHGPVLAEVGEGRDPSSPTGYAPEAIVPVGPLKMAGGGFAVPKFGGSLAPPPPPINRPNVPKFAPRIATPGRFNPGLSRMGLRRSITRAGFQPLVPQFDEGAVAMPYVHAQDGTVSDPNLTDQDTIPGFWGPTGWQKALAVAGAIFPRLGAVANAIPGATWQDPSKPQPPEWQRALGAVNPRLGKIANTINPGKIPQESTSTVAPPPKAPAPGGIDAQKVFWNQEQGHIFQDPTLPKINDAIMVGGGKSLGLPSPSVPRGTQPPPTAGGGGTGGGGDRGTGTGGDGTGGSTGTGGKGSTPTDPGNRRIDYGGPIGPGVGTPPVITGGPGTGGVGDYPLPPGAGGGTLPPPPDQGGTYGIDYGPGPANPSDPNQPPTIPVDTGGGQLPPGVGIPTLPGPDQPGSGDGATGVPVGGGGGGFSGDPSTQFNPDVMAGSTFGPNAGFNPLTGVGSTNSGYLAPGGIVPDSQSLGGYASGGVFAQKEAISKIPRTRFGPTEVVDRPQTRILGARQPQVVVPLRPTKNARVKPSDVPKLAAKFGGRKQPAA